MGFWDFLQRLLDALPSLEKTITSLAIIATVIGALLARAIAFYQRKRLTNEEEAHRETHNLSLFRALSSSNPRLQLAAAAVLVERLKRLKRLGKELSDFQESEKVAIVRALVSVTKASKPDASTPQTESGSLAHSAGIGKFVADCVAEILDDDADEREKRKNKLRAQASPLRPYDWQWAQLRYAWWADVDAREVDFFKADLSHAGMKRAHLQKAQLREAILCETILRGADLSEANLTGAVLTGANLEGANFNGANLCGANLGRVENFSKASFVGAKYNKDTVFPDDSSLADKMAQMTSVGSASLDHQRLRSAAGPTAQAQAAST
jgi:hypothetical protein